MGCIRTVTPSDEEIEELGKELLAWVHYEDLTEEEKEKAPKRFRFPQWYSEEKNILRNSWKALVKTKIFRPYYEQAQSVMANRCVDGTLKEGFGHRYLRLYDREIVEEENSLLKLKAELARKEEEIKAKTLADLAKEAKEGKLSQE